MQKDRTTIYVTPEDKKEMQDFCQVHGLTLSGLVRLAVKDLMKRKSVRVDVKGAAK